MQYSERESDCVFSLGARADFCCRALNFERQMMAGNPSWWSMNGMHPQSHHQLSSEFVYGASNPSLSSNTAADHPTQDFPPIRSSNQLLLGGAEERLGGSLFERQRKLESWEDQVLNSNPYFTRVPFVNVKQEYAQSSCQLYEDEFQVNRPSNCWPHHQVMSVCPPNSCTAILGNSILNFSGGKAAPAQGKKHGQHSLDHLSECNGASTGGVSKKARVQHSSAQPALKVRKEKLGDRITALHQLVSPFGKTDTASVLSEAFESIRFLHGQIQALSSPYMRNAPGSAVHHQHSDSERDGGVKDLRSRGLCLVPITCTQNVGNDVSAADFWASATFGAGRPF